MTHNFWAHFFGYEYSHRFNILTQRWVPLKGNILVATLRREWDAVSLCQTSCMPESILLQLTMYVLDVLFSSVSHLSWDYMRLKWFHTCFRHRSHTRVPISSTFSFPSQRTRVTVLTETFYISWNSSYLLLIHSGSFNDAKFDHLNVAPTYS